LLNGYVDQNLVLVMVLLKLWEIRSWRNNWGPPCQTYSIAGRVRDDKGMQDDYRNYLFEVM
jgi:hypothetical protein